MVESKGLIPMEEFDIQELVSFFDYDGVEYKIDKKLLGKDCPFGGKFEEYNSEVLAALREHWLKTDGNVTDKGQKELQRRKKNMVDYETEKKATLVKKMAEKKLTGKAEVKTKKEMLDEALKSVGYEGGWKLRKDRREGGGWFILFTKTSGQIDEGRTLAKSDLDDLIEAVRTELPKMIKYRK